jgi:DmsE family decaheme c-type cytochrome
MNRLFVILMLIFWGTMLAPVTMALEATSGTPMSGSPEITGQQCLDCHEEETQTHIYHQDCASCHSGSEAHATADKPRRHLPGKTEVTQCLACHETDKRRMHFTLGEHYKADVQCSDCHGIHQPKIDKLNAVAVKGGKTTALCETCHQDVLAKFTMNSHHPVKEGGVTCTNCHNPHGSSQAMLGNATDQCTTCHQEKQGPHAFDHPPVVEDCMTCHDPHGSPMRRLLQTPQPMLCLQCHAPPSNRHGQRGERDTTSRITGAQLRECSSCHNAIHGSGSDQHLRF